MGVIPNLIQTAVSPNPVEMFINEQIKVAHQVAIEENRSVVITGFTGSSNIINGKDERVSYPNDAVVLQAEINGERNVGIEYFIRVYPQGICDDFQIEFEGGLRAESLPILMSAVVK